MKINKYAYAAGVAASLMLFAACGDDVTEVTNVSEKASLDQVEKYKKLPKCEEEIEGSLVYVKDSAKVYACTGDGWVQLNGKDGSDGKNGKDGKDGKDGKSGEDGASCTAKQNKDKTGFDIVCDGKTVGTIKNGEDGENGKKGDKGATGDKGADGTSCTAKQNKDKTGFDIVCGGETKGTIKNGDKGEDGQGCSLEDNGGLIFVTCGEKTVTITKALCGTDPYDPAVSFCAEADTKVYPLCHNALEGNEDALNEDGTYDVGSYFCDATDVLVSRCHAMAYDYAAQFCGRYGVANRCKSVSEGVDEAALNEDGTYSQVTHFCDAKGSLYELCGASVYDTELQFCDREGENPQVVAYCGTGANKTTYDITTHMCVNGKVEDAWDCCIPTGQGKNWCNGHESSKYDVRTHFCDTRDGRPYKYTEITVKDEDGTVTYSETWMAENLAFKNVAEGEATCYNGEDANCDKYGLLYNWNAAMSYCPDGWSLPDTNAYNALLAASGSLKSLFAQEAGGTDLYGFSLLLGGWANTALTYSYLDSYILFWSSTEVDPTRAVRAMNTPNNKSFSWHPNTKTFYETVRCIKDK